MNSQGFAHLVGDNIDTDVIIPARYLNNSDPKTLGELCLIDLDEGFSKRVRQNDVLVAGRNFGCGSSREHAPIAIKACGISCVIARSFARIFYRNAINIGLAILECDEACDKIMPHDEIEINFDTGIITNHTKKEAYQANAFPEFIKNIIEHNGLINCLKGDSHE